MNHQLNCERINFRVLIEALNTCRVDPRWHGRWILDDDWLTIVQQATGSLFATCSRQTLNNAISRTSPLKLSIDDFDSNVLGFLRRCFQVNRERKFWAYYASAPHSEVARPPDGSKWYNEIVRIDFSGTASRTRAALQNQQVNEAEITSAVAAAVVTVSRPSKRRPSTTAQTMLFFAPSSVLKLAVMSIV